jgi:hypothetical protein
VPTQRSMQLGAVVEARQALAQRPPWSALFMKAFAQVSETIPELRRAFVRFPWPHLYEYPLSVASIAVQRMYQGEMAVFFGRVKDPARMSLSELGERILSFRDGEFELQKAFVQAMWFSGLPTPIRRLGWWVGLNIGRQRSNFFGTFGISVYSSQGAESLHPLSPLTTTLNYGVIAPNGNVNVRIVYDHRVMDGATVALALERLETQMNGSILSELRTLASEIRRAA